MPLWLLVFFYLFIAASEILFPARCLNIFERLTGEAGRIRLLSLLMLVIAFLYYAAQPGRLQWLITILFWIYLLSAIWFAAHAKSFASLCNKSFSSLAASEKRFVLYSDCALRTILALLLIYAM